MRFRFRTLLAFVALAGAAVWGDRARRHWILCTEMAERFAEWEQDRLTHPESIRGICGMAYASMTEEERKRDAEEWAAGAPQRRAAGLALATYYAEGKRVFQRAAWRPWESMPDYPPDPE